MKKKKKNFEEEKEKLKEKNICIRKELEEYEDELLEIVSENPDELKLLAKSKGLSNKGEISQLISKLINLKEQNLINQYQIVFILI